VTIKVHHLEIVSHDVDAVCKGYEAAHSANLGDADELLGGTRTCVLPDGSVVGDRGALRDDEEPVVRTHWLVDDVDDAVVMGGFR